MNTSRGFLGFTAIVLVIAVIVVLTVCGVFASPTSASVDAGASASVSAPAAHRGGPILLNCSTVYEVGSSVCRAASSCGFQVWGAVWRWAL